MQQSITVHLSSDLKVALDELTRTAGASPDELVGEAVKQYLFVRRFRSLREKLASKGQSTGVLTDQDVFDRVS
jgi:predicted transcriptional regulator